MTRDYLESEIARHRGNGWRVNEYAWHGCHIITVRRNQHNKRFTFLMWHEAAAEACSWMQCATDLERLNGGGYCRERDWREAEARA